MLENSTLKEYYININKLYNNAVNILTAINQSFHSSSSEINVNYVDSDDLSQTIRIPSFLYLENKIEQLDSNLTNLFNMPQSGEAWFHNSDDMYKLELVKSNNAPVKPILETNNLLAYTKNTNIFKDLVNPKTYLKVDISNLPNNIEKMLVKKFVFFNASTYENLVSSNATTYDEYKSILYNLTKGVDYDEYDSVINLPIKEDDYISNFNIIYVDDTYVDNSSSNKIYKINVNTITYSKEDDSSVELVLQKGQYLCLNNEYAVYKIKDINITQLSNELILEEVIGHMSLQTFEENQNMILHLYNQNYSKFHYIELPLEENQFVAFFISTLYNNVKSTYSEPILLNLAEINIVDENGNKIINNGKPISYLEYYNKYCQNVGDMLLGFSNVAYTQLDNYNISELQDLQNGDTIQYYVTNTIEPDNLKVQRINTHLIDDEFTTKIINLHAKRNEITTNIENIQSNIDSLYNQLVNNDTENDSTISKLSLKSKLDDLYNEKIISQKQLISVIDNINVLKTSVYGTSAAKYRIRGNTNVENIEDYLKSAYYKCNIIQMEVQYKYKSVGSDTTNVQNINSNLFTDWNKLETIERERKIVFDNEINTYHLEYETYNDLTNIIKWNQIEIPITQGEDVTLRIRYKYSIGQPFINLYTPWSDEFTINFPEEFNDNTELTTIITQNDDDVTSAKFLRTLINDGYTEHINNKIINNSQTYFHMPENIYSGFNTSENTFISLKDKLQSMCNDINVYKDIIQSDSYSSCGVFLSINNKLIELLPNKNNNIKVSNIEVTNTFVTKNIDLIIKNTGEIPLKIYSLFPGNSDQYLINIDNEFEQTYNVSNYENIPLLVEGESYVGTNAFNSASYQTLGQLLYFKKNSTYNINSYYIDNYNELINIENNLKNNVSMNNIYEKDSQLTFTYTLSDYINTSKQCTLFPRLRSIININNVINTQLLLNKLTIKFDENNKINDISFNSSSNIQNSNFNINSINAKFNEYDYKSLLENLSTNTNILLNNSLIYRYEHIYGKGLNNIDLLQLTDNYDLSEILNKCEFYINNTQKLNNANDLIGGFFIPTLISQNQILCDNENNSNITINVGDFISIPLTFQYYLGSDPTQTITKTLSFDIKKSLFKSPENYTISITAYNNITSQILNSDNSINYIIDNIEN